MIKKRIDEKKFLALGILSLLLLSVFLIGVVSAQAPADAAADATLKAAGDSLDPAFQVGSSTQAWCSKSSGETAGFLKARLCLWFWGYSTETQESLPAIVEIVKWFMLFIVIILIYSALSYGGFPESAFLRIILSIVTGFLATFFISTGEILTMMISYSALGVTLTVFFPIMILIFFTIGVAKKASPTGIFFSKIIWLIFSIYLFLKAGFLLLVKFYAEKSVSGVVPSGDAIWYNPATWFSTTFREQLFGKEILGGTIEQASQHSTIMLLLLLVVAIAVFIIGVVKNDWVIAWLNKEARESEVEAQKSMLERSRAYDKARSEQVQKAN